MCIELSNQTFSTFWDILLLKHQKDWCPPNFLLKSYSFSDTYGRDDGSSEENWTGDVPVGWLGGGVEVHSYDSWVVSSHHCFYQIYNFLTSQTGMSICV